MQIYILFLPKMKSLFWSFWEKKKKKREILTTDAAGKSVKVVETDRTPSETLQSAQWCQGVHGSTGTGPCCWTGCWDTFLKEKNK